MEVINIHDAKTRLSELLARVEQGEEFVIARAGKPVAKLSGIERPQRLPGDLDQSFRLTESFDQADAEIELLFENSEINPG